MTLTEYILLVEYRNSSSQLVLLRKNGWPGTSNELRAKMSPESRARVEERVRQALQEMPLEELREARDLTQKQLAQVLQVSQGAVSKVERRADMYISTLCSYVRAIGGDLQIRAVFPEGEVLINQFEDLDRASKNRADEA
jgi:DNA-binding XRE family transcriptional regulator